MTLNPKVLSIKIYPKKGAQDELTASAELKVGEGIVGNYRNDISLLTKNAQLFAKQNKNGLCFGRFKANIVIDAISLQNISQLKIKDVVLRIDGGKKFCFADCAHFSEEKMCPFQEGVAFAQVVRGGIISIH